MGKHEERRSFGSITDFAPSQNQFRALHKIRSQEHPRSLSKCPSVRYSIFHMDGNGVYQAPRAPDAYEAIGLFRCLRFSPKATNELFASENCFNCSQKFASSTYLTDVA